MKKIVVMTAVVSMAFGLTASAYAADVVVSSKIDTEGGVIGNIILDALKANNIPVADKIQLGATPIVRKAITEGQIDIYPEYTGNAAFFFNKTDLKVWNDPDAAYQTAKKLDYDANKIVWLTPAKANNTWGVALRKELADQNNLHSWSDLGKYISAGKDIKLAASSEFVNSPAALPAFESTYNFTVKPSQLIVLSGGDTAATMAAAANETSGANAAMINGTDGGITAAGLVVMDDDKHVQPVYQPTAIIREAVLKQYPQIETILAPIFATLDLKTLQELNGRVQVDGVDASTVARDFLKSHHFIQ